MSQQGEYIVGFAQEEAEGLYRLTDGSFDWSEPADGENCHLEVAVADGRFIPALSVQATLTGDDGETVGPVDLPLLWHPGLYHYGRNVQLPGDGSYDTEVSVEPPTVPRHDQKNGDRFGDSVTVRFEGVGVKTGQS